MPKIREATYNDFEGIRILQKRYDLPTKNYEEQLHLWKNNPAFTDVKKSWPIGWVIENEDKQIVGYFGNIPMAYEFKGKRLIAAAATSIVVDTKYRNYSISLARNYFVQRSADLFLGTSTNYEAGKVFSAFKVPKIPADSYDIFLFWIINYQRFISSIFNKKALPLGCIFKYPLSLAMCGVDKLIKRNQYINKSNREIQYCTVFDERFDVFWNNLKKRYHNRILCVRNKEHLDWHFRYAITNKKIWIFVHGKNSRINGYAIFLRQDNPEISLKRIRLIDIQSIDEESDILEELISSAMKKCQKEDIHMLEIIGFNPQKRNVMEKYSPYKRKMPAWPLFYKAKDNSLAKELMDPEAWDPCLLDGDASL